MGDAASTIAWVDLSDRLFRGSVQMGKNSDLDRIEPARASFTLNSYDDALDPLNPDGPYYSRVRSLARVSLSVEWAGVVYPLYMGFLRSWSHQRSDLDTKVVTLECVDVGTALNRMDSPESIWGMDISFDRPTHWWKLGRGGGTQLSDSGTGIATGLSYYVSGGSSLGLGDGGKTGVFDGEKSVVYIPNGVGLSSPWSIEFAFRSTQLGQRHRQIYHQVGGIGISLIGGEFVSDLGKLGVTLNNGATLATVKTPQRYDGGPHHGIVTFDGSTLRIYVDGFLVASGAAPVPWSGGPTIIGGYTADVGSPHLWEGEIGDVTTYDKVLTETTVARHYQSWKTGWSGDSPGARVQRLLNFAALSGTERELDAGTCRLGPTELGEEVLAHLTDVADSEGGAFYTDGSGRYVFRGREYLIVNERASTVQATFTDIAGDGMAYDLPTDAVVDDKTLWNRAVVTRAGGAEQKVEDLVAQARDGVRTVTRSGLLYDSDAEAYSAAHRILRRATLPTRMGTITVLPMREPDTLYPAALGREMYDRVRWKHRPDSSTFTEDLHVQGMAHTFEATDSRLWWETKLSVSRAADPAVYMRLGTGRLGTARLY